MNCCGTCLYGKNQAKYTSKCECMLENYTPHLVSHGCTKFQRDYKKQSVITTKKTSESN